ncbi:MAG: immunoglobulin-like domain-containing protein [Anaerotignum sp.]
MRKKLFALLTILILALTGCGGDYTTVFDEVNTVEGVTLTLKADTLKGSRATFIIKNDSAEDVLFDPVEYHLENKNKEGVWEENIGTRESKWKRDTTETIPAGTSMEREVDWKGLCGSIGSGQYRVILIVNDQPIACEFEK